MTAATGPRRRRLANVWLLSLVAAAVVVVALAWMGRRDPAVAGRAQALNEASALLGALETRARGWLSGLRAGEGPAPLLRLRVDEDGTVVDPRPLPPGRPLTDAGEDEALSPAARWLATGRQRRGDPKAAAEAYRSGLESLQDGQRATEAALRLELARVAPAAEAVTQLRALQAEFPTDALLDGEPLGLVVGHRLADALADAGERSAADLTREELLQRLLAGEIPLAPERLRSEVRFALEAAGRAPEEGLPPAIEQRLRELEWATSAAARLDAAPAGAELLRLDDEHLLVRADRGWAVHARRTLRASLLAAWMPLLPDHGAFKLASAEAVSEGDLMGVPAAPAGLGGWALVLADAAPYAEDVAFRQQVLFGATGALALALVLVGLIGRRALLRQAQLERLRTEFIAGVSHELRTPAASMMLLSENLAEGRVTDEERRRESLQALHRDARRLQRLVSDVLDASRLERGAFQVRPAAVDPGRLLRRLADEQEPRLRDAGLRLHVEIADDLPDVEWDADAIERAVANLLENARKYAAEGEEVWLRARMQGRVLRIEVEDRGPGVPEAWRARIFESFTRVPAGEKLAAGAGLGLSLVQAAVMAHGGDATLEPGEGGRGARFVLRLPVDAVPEA